MGKTECECPLEVSFIAVRSVNILLTPPTTAIQHNSQTVIQYTQYSRISSYTPLVSISHYSRQGRSLTSLSFLISVDKNLIFFIQGLSWWLLHTTRQITLYCTRCHTTYLNFDVFVRLWPQPTFSQDYLGQYVLSFYLSIIQLCLILSPQLKYLCSVWSFCSLRAGLGERW